VVQKKAAKKKKTSKLSATDYPVLGEPRVRASDGVGGANKKCGLLVDACE
jgi:hypothetical protein